MVFPIQQGLFKFDVIDYYAILGVSVDADIHTIRQRYLKIAYRLHPDTCKAETQAEKERANELLSRLVNPAYENLHREPSRQEFRLIIARIGKDLPKSLSQTTLVSEGAKKLSQSTNNVDLAYSKLLQSVAVDQYKTLDLIYQKIAQISELNLVYLALLEGQNRKKIAQSATVVDPVNTPTQEPASPSPEESNLSVYIRRAQNCLNRNSPGQAILELKDALKLDPSDTICHALLGLAYLKQNQTSMAKVHINRAWRDNPNNPIVSQSKRELEQVLTPAPEDKKAKKTGGETAEQFLDYLWG